MGRQQWEYLIWPVDDNERNKQLRRRGEEGWELIRVVRTGGWFIPRWEFWFKRPKQ